MAFAACHTRSLFEAPERRPYDAAFAERGLTSASFKPTAASTLNSLFSFVPVSFDSARICLSLITAQISAVMPGLIRLTTIGGSTADLLVNGKFSPIYTPCQAGGVSVRRADFLSRSRKSPFHSRKYDALAASRIYERKAIQSLYKCELMKQDDTRILLVGLPAGLQHVMGSEQRYVKVVITRRDQADSSRTFLPVSYVFDTYTFLSTSVSAALGKSPWTLTGNGNLQESVKSIQTYGVALSSGKAYGNLSNTTIESIQVPNLVSPSLTGRSGTTSSSGDERTVQISDFIVDLEFMDSFAASSEVSFTTYPVSSSPVIVGNHLVDALLKTHILNVAGLDLNESTFTTSDTAFNISTSAGLDDARSYVFNICTLDFINMTRATDSAAFTTDVKMLDLLSRTPIMRSRNYADLCLKPTYLDRVFAVPINLRMFKTS